MRASKIACSVIARQRAAHRAIWAALNGTY
jgi:hypothetical protein